MRKMTKIGFKNNDTSVIYYFNVESFKKTVNKGGRLQTPRPGHTQSKLIDRGRVKEKIILRGSISSFSDKNTFEQMCTTWWENGGYVTIIKGTYSWDGVVTNATINWDVGQWEYFDWNVTFEVGEVST